MKTRLFDHFNNSNGIVCPVCKTGEDKPTVLVEIDGTLEDDIAEAIQVHHECAIVQRYNRESGLLYIKTMRAGRVFIKKGKQQ